MVSLKKGRSIALQGGVVIPHRNLAGCDGGGYGRVSELMRKYNVPKW